MLITLFDIGITPGLLFAFGMVKYDTYPNGQLKPDKRQIWGIKLWDTQAIIY